MDNSKPYIETSAATMDAVHKLHSALEAYSLRQLEVMWGVSDTTLYRVSKIGHWSDLYTSYNPSVRTVRKILDGELPTQPRLPGF